MKATSKIATTVLAVGMFLSGLSASASAQTPADDVVVRVGAAPVAGHTAVFAAHKFGYFEEEGVNVELVSVRSGTDAQAALIAGRLEFIGVNSITFIHGVHENIGLVAAADAFRIAQEAPATSALLVRTDGSIENPKDLEGKTLGIIARRSQPEMYLNLWAEERDLDTSTIRIMELAYPQMIDALTSGQLDAVITLEPFIAQGLETGRVKVLAYPSFEVEPGHASAFWVGTATWMNANPDAVDRFVRALYRAHERLMSNREELVDLTVEWTDQPRELISKAVPDFFATSIGVESLQGQADNMKKLGWIERSVDVSGAIWTAR